MIYGYIRFSTDINDYDSSLDMADDTGWYAPYVGNGGFL